MCSLSQPIIVATHYTPKAFSQSQPSGPNLQKLCTIDQMILTFDFRIYIGDDNNEIIDFSNWAPRLAENKGGKK